MKSLSAIFEDSAQRQKAKKGYDSLSACAAGGEVEDCTRQAFPEHASTSFAENACLTGRQAHGAQRELVHIDT